MIHFLFSDKDIRYLFLKGESDYDLKYIELFKQYCSFVDPICYLPSYKQSGKPIYTHDFVWKYKQPSGSYVYYCSIGLWQEAYKFFKSHNVEFDGLLDHQHLFKHKLQHTFDEFKIIVEGWGLKFPPRPYQLEAAYKILQWNKSLSLLSTRAGKTLISYIIFRYEMEYMGMKKILMIVPSIQLVKQAYNDFVEYAEFFDTECIWGGGKQICSSTKITVGTFQSLIKFLDKKSSKYNPSFFDDYDCVFVDEVHRATAAQIKTIISQPFMKNVKIAFGMTGTLPKEHTIEDYCLHSLLGPKIQSIEPRELMDEGYISDIEINQVRLSYQDTEKVKDLYIKCAEYVLSDFITEKDKNGKNIRIKLEHTENQVQFRKCLPIYLEQVKSQLYYKYPNEWKSKYIIYLRKTAVPASLKGNALVIERMMVHFLDERIKYLCEMILTGCDKNTLILAHHTDYIRKVEKIVKEYFPNKHILVITGSIGLKQREEIVQILKENNDCILIASYGTMSTGITLPNLCYGVLFESFKSNVINMQSLGRGLGLSKLKDKYIVYDVIDKFDKDTIGSSSIYRQGIEKTKIYKENRYSYNIIEEKI